MSIATFDGPYSFMNPVSQFIPLQQMSVSDKEQPKYLNLLMHRSKKSKTDFGQDMMSGLQDSDEEGKHAESIFYNLTS